MRLIQIESGDGDKLRLSFKEYFEEQVPPYAILSHTWGPEEVTYEDVLAGRGRRTEGYRKIRGCARKAKERGYSHIWIDTCCIDKRSSAELTEAINSMFNWYKKADECYALLSDVPERTWQNSRWFTRGWTLQELIAPRYLIFYDRHWSELGSKSVTEGIIMHLTLIPVATETNVYEAVLNAGSGMNVVAILLLEMDVETPEQRPNEQRRRRFVRIRPDLMRQRSSREWPKQFQQDTEILVLDLLNEPLLAHYPDLDMHVEVDCPTYTSLVGYSPSMTVHSKGVDFPAAPAIGKMFTLSFHDRDGHPVLVDAGLNEFCVPWCRIVSRSSSPVADLTSQQHDDGLYKLRESYEGYLSEHTTSSDQLHEFQVRAYLYDFRRRIILKVEARPTSELAPMRRHEPDLSDP